MTNQAAALSRVSGLSASIVPHRRWAISKWFYANPLWYYHRRGTDEEIVTDQQFFRLVDPDLRELCYILNQAGLRTTPSCQGHVYERPRFERIWNELTREASAICDGGLMVKDSETDRESLFADRNYTLPWKSFDEFFAEINDHQGTGYIGVVVPRDRPELIDRFKNLKLGPGMDGVIKLGVDPELAHVLSGEVFDFFVQAEAPAQRHDAWMSITDAVRDAVGDGNGKKPRD